MRESCKTALDVILSAACQRRASKESPEIKTEKVRMTGLYYLADF